MISQPLRLHQRFELPLFLRTTNLSPYAAPERVCHIDINVVGHFYADQDVFIHSDADSTYWECQKDTMHMQARRAKRGGLGVVRFQDFIDANMTVKPQLWELCEQLEPLVLDCMKDQSVVLFQTRLGFVEANLP